MKNTFLLSVFLISLINTSVFAQDYQPFKNTYTYQYSYTIKQAFGQNNPNAVGIHSVQVDSANRINGDYIFYFNKLQRFTDNFWGESMIKKKGGDYLFSFHTRTDTMVLKTNGSLGEQWFFLLNEETYIATYKSIRKQTVLNNTIDSVKTFIIQNNSGFLDSIKISRLYGMIYSFSFINLNKSPTDPTATASKFKMEYIFNTNTGINRMNYFNYFTYEEGDMFIYSSHEPDTRPSNIGNSVYKVLSKKISPNKDTIVYKMIVCSINDIVDGKYITTNSYRTLKVTEFSISPNFYPLLYLLQNPLNKYVSANPMAYYAFKIDTVDTFLSMQYPIDPFEGITRGGFGKNIGFSGYSITGMPESPWTYYYLKEHYSQVNTDDNCDAVDLVLSVSDPLKESSSVLVSPNPFTEQCVIKGNQLPPGNYTVRIHSVMGTEVYRTDILVNSEDSSLTLSNLAALAPGFYTVSIEGDQKLFRCSVVRQ